MMTAPRQVLLRVACSVLLASVLAVPPAESQPAPDVVGSIDSLGTALASGHDAGGAVIGLLLDDTTTARGFGTVDSTGRRPSARTVFEIGSVTKTFTGLLLADAIERGHVSPTTPVRALLPDSISLPAPDSALTLTHLATHRSGLPRLPHNLGAAVRPTDPYAAYGDSALYAFLDGYELPRAPGTAYEYSNLGMGLLGHLLARRADTSYAALVRDRIAEPMGLSDTGVDLTAAQERRFAQGHTRDGTPVSPWHFDALAGAGALRSTGADMLSYLRAHRAVLKASSDSSSLHRAMRRSLTVRAPTSQDSTRIGLGWHETTRNGRRIVWHNGGTGGFRSFVGFDRATGRGAVVLVNTARASDLVLEAGTSLIEALHSE